MTGRTRLTVILSLAAIVLLGVVAADMVLRGPGQMGDGTPVRSSGQALVGGPFTLTDQDGRRVTPADYRGKYLLIYFGYTFCPDVCPAELQVMTAALDIVGDKAEKIQALFITIDPARDTVAQMKDYIGNFHKRFAALTGSAGDIAKAAKAYRVYYKKVAAEDGSNDYLMDHSSIVYLMDRSNKFLVHFPYGTGPEKMAAGIEKFVK